MSMVRKQGLLPITVFIGLMLGLFPIPNALQPFEPYWLGLILAYWVIETPTKVGIGRIFFLGIIADLLYGGLLGEQAFRLVLMTSILQRFRTRIRFFPLWQQALVIGCVFFNDLIVSSVIHQVLGTHSVGWRYGFSTVITMLLWPLLFLWLDHLRLGKQRE